MRTDREEYKLLYARIDDLCERAQRGEIAESCFLSPAELHHALAYLGYSGSGTGAVAFGGYADSERKKLFLLPEYAADAKEYGDIAVYLDSEPIAAVGVRESGFRKLTHRDYLGSLLSLGIERSVIGDIVLQEGESLSAVIFCEPRIADYIAGSLVKIGNDSVKTERITVGEDFSACRRFAHISDTVSSARIDCVVAALCSLSRDKARAAVLSESVEVDFECEPRPDRQISAPCIVSVRGFGRFKVNSVSELTRKGRLRLDADKFL